MGRKCLGGHFEGGGGGEEKGKEGNRDEVRQKGGKTWINKLACGVHRIGANVALFVPSFNLEEGGLPQMSISSGPGAHGMSTNCRHW